MFECKGLNGLLALFYKLTELVTERICKLINISTYPVKFDVYLCKTARTLKGVEPRYV